jgi:glycosyltransferase involved in cell wall biosynthesis
VELGKSGRFGSVAPLRRLVSHLNSSGADIIYSFLPMENLFGLAAAKASGLPIVWGIRGAAVNRWQYGLTSRILYGLQFGLLRQANAVICNSYAAAHEIDPGRARQLHVIPNGIDIAHYAPSRERRETWRNHQGFESGATVIGIVARIDPMKDHSSFLRAATIVARSVQRAVFVVAGGGNRAYMRSLQKLGHELGLGDRVRWLGEIADPADIYRGADVIVSSSAYGEGFSNALGEAMATGAAVVATDVGDSRRVVGQHGTIVPPREPGELADAIVAALAADSAEARERRAVWIAERFSVDTMVSQTEAVLVRLANRS